MNGLHTCADKETVRPYMHMSKWFLYFRTETVAEKKCVAVPEYALCCRLTSKPVRGCVWMFFASLSVTVAYQSTVLRKLQSEMNAEA